MLRGWLVWGFSSKPFRLLVMWCAMWSAMWCAMWCVLCALVVEFAAEVHGRSSLAEFMVWVGGCVVFFVVSLFYLYILFIGLVWVCGDTSHDTHHHLSTFIIPCIESKSNYNGVLCREITKTTKRHK